MPQSRSFYYQFYALMKLVSNSADLLHGTNAFTGQIQIPYNVVIQKELNDSCYGMERYFKYCIDQSIFFLRQILTWKITCKWCRKELFCNLKTIPTIFLTISNCLSDNKKCPSTFQYRSSWIFKFRSWSMD